MPDCSVDTYLAPLAPKPRPAGEIKFMSGPDCNITRIIADELPGESANSKIALLSHGVARWRLTVWGATR
jgi:hypothetical protein